MEFCSRLNGLIHCNLAPLNTYPFHNNNCSKSSHVNIAGKIIGSLTSLAILPDIDESNLDIFVILLSKFSI